MIKKIGVLGAGTMGHGIAEAFAMHGYQVNVYEPADAVRNSALNSIEGELQLLAGENLIKSSEIPAILERISLFDDLAEAMNDRDYVIEATPELMDIKQKVFKSLHEICPAETIIASNTSSLKLMEMAELIPPERKEKIMVCHWYNPGHIMPIAELSFFGNMPEATFEEVRELYKSIGKQPVKVLKDIPGLLANRIQQAVAREVFSLIEMGAAEPEDIDKALIFGPAFRYATTGQLEIADFGGLDIWKTVGDNLLSVMDNSRQANELMKQKVEDGHLGFKTGKGFFDYDDETKDKVKEKFLKKLVHQLKACSYYA